MMGLAKDVIKYSKSGKIKEVVDTIFQRGLDLGNKNIKFQSRIWANIILRCIQHLHGKNYVDYINNNQKYMLYYLPKGTKMNLPSILFKYLREVVKETRNGGCKQRKWIPLGRLISDILIESK